MSVLLSSLSHHLGARYQRRIDCWHIVLIRGTEVSHDGQKLRPLQVCRSSFLLRKFEVDSAGSLGVGNRGDRKRVRPGTLELYDDKPHFRFVLLLVICPGEGLSSFLLLRQAPSTRHTM